MTVSTRLQAALDAEGSLMFLARYVYHVRCGQGAAWFDPGDVPALQAEAEERWGEHAEILSWDVQRRERRRWRRLEFKLYLDVDKRWYGDAIAPRRRAPSLAELLQVMHAQRWLVHFELYLYADGLDEGAIVLPAGGIIHFQRSRGGVFRLLLLQGGYVDTAAKGRAAQAIRNALQRSHDLAWLRRHIDAALPWEEWLAPPNCRNRHSIG
ncbi:MAG: hypothetical protein ACN6PQ_08095 [Stenotrophomonas indicatrix]|jgi:hypothetical protein|uniref:Uncharacterized protein n=1 Tax=Knufia peltigerae TaxID=1002370 RepID=A0AA39CRN1_9EURO|nr:hypothetical protein H2204_013151 [Knufia peltigerae]